jgi:hypothetical protein
VIETSREALAPGIDIIAQGRGDLDLVTADLNLHDWLLKHQGDGSPVFRRVWRRQRRRLWNFRLYSL